MSGVDSPRTIVRRNVAAYLAAHAIALVAVFAALRSGDAAAAKVWATILGTVGPMCLVCTVLEALRSWRGQPPNPAFDMSVPALLTFATGSAIYCWL